MGTRNLTMVISEKKTKVAQYGQWDGYPEGQGKTALNLLRSFDLKKFKEKVDKLTWITDKQTKEVEATKDWHIKYPYLSRDTGAKILDAIYNGRIKDVSTADYSKRVTVKVPKILGLVNEEKFAADGLFCEFAYVIDLDKRTFEVYEGFKTEPLKKGERFFKYNKKSNGEYSPVKHVKTFDLDNLPTEREFLKTMKELLGE